VRFINLHSKVRTGAGVTTKNIIEHKGLILFESVGPFRPRWRWRYHNLDAILTYKTWRLFIIIINSQNLVRSP